MASAALLCFDELYIIFPNMNCTIVGAGLLGLSSAWYLSLLGYRVKVFESHSDVSLETSFANGGMLHASEASPWNHPGIFQEALKMLGKEDSALLIRPSAVPFMLPWIFSFFKHSRLQSFERNLKKNLSLARYSLEVMRHEFLSKDSSYQIGLSGILKIFYDKDEMNQGVLSANKAREFGTSFEVLDKQMTVELEPSLAPISSKLCGSIYFPEDMCGDAYEFSKLLKKNCEKNGVEFFFNSKVQSLAHENKKLNGVVVKDQHFPCDLCVVSAGTSSKSLLKTAKIPLSVEPVKGYSVTIPMDNWKCKPQIPVIDEQKHAAVCPLSNSLRVAGTAEFAGDNKVLTEKRLENLITICRSLFPEEDISQEVFENKPWCGFRPMTPDGVGIVGETPINGLYVNTGHGHLGWTMALGSGKMLASVVNKSECPIDASDYSYNRF